MRWTSALLLGALGVAGAPSAAVDGVDLDAFRDALCAASSVGSERVVSVADSLADLAERAGAVDTAAACRALNDPTSDDTAALDSALLLLGDAECVPSKWAQLLLVRAELRRRDRSLVLRDLTDALNVAETHGIATLEASALSKLLSLHIDLRSYERAIAYGERALEANERAYGPESPRVATVLSNLGGIRTRPVETRLADLDRAERIRRAAFGDDHPKVAMIAYNRGRISLRAGKLDAAREHTERARRVWSTHGDPNEPWADIQLARIAIEDGRTDDALRTAEEIRTRWPDSERLRGDALALTFRAHLAAGHAERAWPVAMERFALAQNDLERQAISLPHETAARSSRTRNRALVHLYEAFEALDAPDDAMNDLWRAVITARGSLLRASAARSRAMVQARAESGDAARLAREMAAALHAPDADADEIERVRDDYERAVSGLLAVEVPEAVDLATVFDGLPGGSALVAYVSMLGNYRAFVRVDGRTSMVTAGETGDIDSLVTAWRSELTDGFGPPFVANAAETRMRAVGAELRRRLWDPVVAAVAGSDRVYVVPTGPLTFLRFASLPTDDDGYVVDGPVPIHRLAHEGDLAIAPTESSKGALFAGGFDFGTDLGSGTLRGTASTCADVKARRFPPLTGSDAEVDRLSTVWRAAVDEPVAIVRGAGRREAEFVALMEGRRVVHIATHGFALASCPALSPDGLRDPLVECGLVVGDGRDGGLDDDLLTGLELSLLDLRGTEWVVLSACDSGGGRPAELSDVLGLPHALRAAGAATVIVSLWPVSDDATIETMVHLYEARFSREQSTVDAMWTATKRTLDRRRSAGLSTHPALWGAFVAVGDWR